MARLERGLGLLLIAVLAAGCTSSGGPASAGGSGSPSGGSGPSGSGGPAASAGATGSLSPAASGSGGNAGSVALPGAILDPILADAAQRSGIARDSLELISAEEHTWPNAGLGCPVRGVLYTQALVDGYQIVIRADGSTFDYRGSGPGQFRLCSETKG